nr:MAG TPA: hypothetical protein [Caudoviricetes sp.]
MPPNSELNRLRVRAKALTLFSRKSKNLWCKLTARGRSPSC